MISTTDRKVQYAITGAVPATFAIPFKYWETAELKALLTTSSGDTLLTEGVDYSISTPGDSGTLTRLNTWAVATQLTIYRELDLTQETSLVNGGTQDAPTYMKMVDRTVGMIQEVKETQDRIVRFPISDTTTSPDMPSALDRKGKYLGFDATTGDPVAVTAAVGGTVVSAYMTTLLDDADAMAAQETLCLIASGSTAAISTYVQTLLGSQSLLDLQKNAGMLPAGATVALTSAVQNLLNTANALYVNYSGATVDVNATSVQGAIENVAAATLKDFITNAGLTYSPSNLSVLFTRGVNRYAHDIGDPVDSFIARAASADHPALPIYDGDHDISATNWPLLVPILRAEALADKSGTVSFSGTIASGVITFSAAAASWLTIMSSDEAVHGSYTSWWSLNNGTNDYAISALNPSGYTATVASPPANGTYTWTCYLYRIPGSTTTARVLKDQGNALVSVRDQLVMNGAGGRRLWATQGHRHTPLSPQTTFWGDGGAVSAPSTAGARSYVETTGDPTTDGTNGTPLTAKTTHGPERAVYRYIWGGVYNP